MCLDICYVFQMNAPHLLAKMEASVWMVLMGTPATVYRVMLAHIVKPTLVSIALYLSLG